MKLNSALLACLFLFSSLTLNAERKEILLNDNWQFRLSCQVQNNSTERVDLPHTWNAQDALAGNRAYHRGIGNYTRQLNVLPEWKYKRLFLRFEGANSITNLFINGQHIGEHRGGYGAFVFEITNHVIAGQPNTILVRVNNAEQLNVMPLCGDFNFYGGIYRPVHLLVTDALCISPLNYASSGVQLIQANVSRAKAHVQARIDLSNRMTTEQLIDVELAVKDATRTVTTVSRKVTLPAHTTIVEELPFDLQNPHLWNGRQDPFLYQIEVTLYRNGAILDRVVQPLGLRFYHIDPNKGFFLNGQHLSLKGVCRHQDRSEIGNALHLQHHEEDVALMCEMGVNAVRLAHYPQAKELYDLMDQKGLIVWAEIPFVGPGGYADKGFINQPSFRDNGKEQLKELIRQHYNHPSICFWGLFNELKESGDNPIEYVKELNALAHQEDPTRPTTAASNQSGKLNEITDVIAWNRYDGWYGGLPANIGTWLDTTHRKNPDFKIGISEYGAGAALYHQQDTLTATSPTSKWHPENWQTYYHIENWKAITARPFIWGSFVWNMFDFGAAHRTEGDRPGINDKGLITFDRKVRKDAFYFYKANWNKQAPMIHLAGKRQTLRTHPLQTIQAFSTRTSAELFVNGKSVGETRTDTWATLEWKNVKLQSGENEIRVVTTDNETPLSDSFHCRLEL
ncbi:MAG: glycoside hydrolase family 2 TIM barrel-domain containing protein [Kiritimatiellia bacterium]